MVGKVLTDKGITAYGNGASSLISGDELSDAERDALQQLCRQRLDAFREQRGGEVFAHRSRHRSPISGSVKCRVHLCARGRCECGGAHEHQRALEVDHIVPKNQGGSDAISNLQALCFHCNAGKQWPLLVSELHRQGLTQLAGISCHTCTASDWISSTRLIRSVSFPCWIS